MNRLTITFACLLLCGLAGCAQRFIRPPAVSGELLTPVAKAQLLLRLEQISAEIDSLKLLSRTRINSGSKSSTLRHVFVFNAPDKFRLEALPLNSAYALQVFVLNGDRTVLIDPADHKSVSGKADGSQLKRFFGVALKEQELPYFLLGRLPHQLIERFRQDVSAALYFDSAKNRYFLRLGEYEYYMELDADTLLATRIEYRDVLAQRLQTKLILSNIEQENPPRFFRELEITLPREEVEVSLKITSAKFGMPLAPGFFEVR